MQFATSRTKRREVHNLEELERTELLRIQPKSMKSRFRITHPALLLDMLFRIQPAVKRPHFLGKRSEIVRSLDHVLTVVQVSCLRDTVIVIVVLTVV